MFFLGLSCVTVSGRLFSRYQGMVLHWNAKVQKTTPSHAKNTKKSGKILFSTINRGQFKKMMYLCTAIRDLAQLVAHYVRDVGVGRSSRLIPTASTKGCPKAAFLAYVSLPHGQLRTRFFFFERQVGWAKGDKGSVSFVGGTPPLFYFPDIFLFTCAWSGCLLAFHLFAFPMISLGSVGIAPLCVHT